MLRVEGGFEIQERDGVGILSIDYIHGIYTTYYPIIKTIYTSYYTVTNHTTIKVYITTMLYLVSPNL